MHSSVTSQRLAGQELWKNPASYYYRIKAEIVQYSDPHCSPMYLKCIIQALRATFRHNFSGWFMDCSQFWIFQHFDNPFDRLRVYGDESHADGRPPRVEPWVSISGCCYHLGIGKGLHYVLNLENCKTYRPNPIKAINRKKNYVFCWNSQFSGNSFL